MFNLRKLTDKQKSRCGFLTEILLKGAKYASRTELRNVFIKQDLAWGESELLGPAQYPQDTYHLRPLEVDSVRQY